MFLNNFKSQYHTQCFPKFILGIPYALLVSVKNERRKTMKSVIKKELQESFKQFIYSLNFDEIYSNNILISNIEKFELELVKETSNSSKKLKILFKKLFNSISEKEKEKNQYLVDINLKIMALLSPRYRTCLLYTSPSPRDV